jgi:hypothetical protein
MATPRKKRAKNPSLSADEIDISKAEQINIEQLLAQALLRHKNDQFSDKKLKVKEMQHLSSIIGEYLNCFILVGYTMQDERALLIHMPTPKDEAALIDLMRETLIDLASERP